MRGGTGLRVLVASATVLVGGRAYAGAVVSVGCGLQDTCVVFGTGSMWCWGRNDVGQLGDGTTIDRHFPISIDAGVRFAAVGDRNVCHATLRDESAVCVGANEFGQIGDGTIIERHVNTPVQFPTNWDLGLNNPPMVTGDTPCVAFLARGPIPEPPFVGCWGSNQFGSVGDGTTTDRSLPVAVVSGGTGVAVSGGGGHTCALVPTGMSSSPSFTLWCWGNNVDDALGVGPGPGAMSTSPVQVPIPNGGPSGSTIGLGVGVDHTCIVTADKTLWCWGLNDHGQLGDGTTMSSDAPVQVVGLTNLYGVWVSPSGGFTCAVTVGPSGTASSTNAYCWGRNDRGQVGDGTTTDRTIPTVLSGLGGVGILSAGMDHSCAYFFGTGPGTDRVACWGANDRGQVGDATTTDRHAPVFLTFSTTPPSVPALGAASRAAIGALLLAAGMLVMGARARSKRVRSARRR
jgi:alpha-tubulin suppressor-like RCC1 family protein